MRLLSLVIFSALACFSWHHASPKYPPQLYHELRLLSFIPNLELYSQVQSMTTVDLHKIDFFKSKSPENAPPRPVLDSLIKIPARFQGYLWS